MPATLEEAAARRVSSTILSLPFAFGSFSAINIALKASIVDKIKLLPLTGSRRTADGHVFITLLLKSNISEWNCKFGDSTTDNASLWMRANGRLWMLMWIRRECLCVRMYVWWMRSRVCMQLTTLHKNNGLHMDLPKLCCRNNCVMCVYYLLMWIGDPSNWCAGKRPNDSACNEMDSICRMKLSEMPWLESNNSGSMVSQWNLSICQLVAAAFWLKVVNRVMFSSSIDYYHPGRDGNKTNKSIEFHMKAISVGSIFRIQHLKRELNRCLRENF